MMRAKGNSLTLREDEKSFYNSLFLILDVDGTGVLRRPQFIPLLQRTGLDAEVLGSIVRLAVSWKGDGSSLPEEEESLEGCMLEASLSQTAWFACCKLVAQHQALGRLDMGLLWAKPEPVLLPLPDFSLTRPQLGSPDAWYSADKDASCASEVSEIRLLSHSQTGGGGRMVHTVYNISAMFGVKRVVVQRRYKDFAWLRESLSTRLGLLVPPLPEKRWMPPMGFSRSQHSFVQERGKRLERFLVRVVEHPFLSKSMEMMIFLKATPEGMKAARSILPWMRDLSPPVVGEGSNGWTYAGIQTASSLWGMVVSSAKSTATDLTTRYHVHIGGGQLMTDASRDMQSRERGVYAASKAASALAQAKTDYNQEMGRCGRALVLLSEMLDRDPDDAVETSPPTPSDHREGEKSIGVAGRRMEKLALDAQGLLETENSGLLGLLEEHAGYMKAFRAVVQQRAAAVAGEQGARSSAASWEQEVDMIDTVFQQEVIRWKAQRLKELLVDICGFAKHQVVSCHRAHSAWSHVQNEMAGGVSNGHALGGQFSPNLSIDSTTASASMFLGQTEVEKPPDKHSM